MSNNLAAATINVSLEDHLADSLRPLLAILPEQIAAELKDVLEFTLVAPHMPSHGPEMSEHVVVRTIPYPLLAAISKWTRTSAAECAMRGHQPPLRVQDYSMIALLAGSRTSPERRFPLVPTTPVSDSQVSHSRDVGDRRAVTAVANALLSIGGSGVATWWAAGRLLWREEWKVLLAFSVAVLVAASEIILYLIWDGQRNNPHRRRATHIPRPTETSGGLSPSQDKKWDPDSACGSREVDSRMVPHINTTTAVLTHISSIPGNTFNARSATSSTSNTSKKHF